MKRTLAGGQGYTIVETLIFIAVTGVLFVSASMLIAGQQRKTEFVQGVREFESKLQDILNDVATGYYVSNGGFTCQANASALGFPPGATQQGGNNQCIFIGKVVQLNSDGTVTVFGVAGRKQASGRDVTTLQDAWPTALYPVAGNGAPSNLNDSSLLSGAIKPGWIRYTEGGAQNSVGAAGLFTTFGQYQADGTIKSGTQDVSLVGLRGTTLTSSTAQAAEAINTIANYDVNPDDGVKICLDSGGTSQRAIITIGGANRQTGITSIIENGRCADV